MIAFLMLIAAIAPEQAQDNREGRTDGFYVVQMAVPDIDTLEREWAVPGEGVNVTGTSSLVRNQATFTTVSFAGCTPDPAGLCRISVAYRVFSPDGSPYGDVKGEPNKAFEGHVDDPRQMYLGGAYMGLRIEPGETLGEYTVQATTTDEVAHKSVVTSQVLTAVEAEAAAPK